MRVRLLSFLLLSAGIFCASSIRAQEAPQVEASLAPDSVMIGDRFRLKVQITKDVAQVTHFPDFEGKFTEHIEILKEGKIDTLERDGRTLKLSREYILTSFEEGYHSMGRFPILYADKNIIDTIFSRDSLLIKVATFSIDTVSQTIYDIKQPLKAPVKFGEFSGYLFGGIFLLAVIAVLIYYLIRRYKNKPLLGKKTYAEPPHVTAIRKLERLKGQKLWQAGKHKLYYTQITDILREYIDKRYGVKALEMTSAEIRSALTPILAESRSLRKLSDILVTADFVKFAKYTPDPDLNDALYYDAYDFIESTKEVIEADDISRELNTEENIALISKKEEEK